MPLLWKSVRRTLRLQAPLGHRPPHCVRPARREGLGWFRERLRLAHICLEDDRQVLKLPPRPAYYFSRVLSLATTYFSVVSTSLLSPSRPVLSRPGIASPFFLVESVACLSCLHVCKQFVRRRPVEHSGTLKYTVPRVHTALSSQLYQFERNRILLPWLRAVVSQPR